MGLFVHFVYGYRLRILCISSLYLYVPPTKGAKLATPQSKHLDPVNLTLPGLRVFGCAEWVRSRCFGWRSLGSLMHLTGVRNRAACKSASPRWLMVQHLRDVGAPRTLHSISCSRFITKSNLSVLRKPSKAFLSSSDYASPDSTNCSQKENCVAGCQERNTPGSLRVGFSRIPQKVLLRLLRLTAVHSVPSNIR
jgi:hypothetical protein